MALDQLNGQAAPAEQIKANGIPLPNGAKLFVCSTVRGCLGTVQIEQLTPDALPHLIEALQRYAQHQAAAASQIVYADASALVGGRTQ